MKKKTIILSVIALLLVAGGIIGWVHYDKKNKKEEYVTTSKKMYRNAYLISNAAQMILIDYIGNMYYYAKHKYIWGNNAPFEMGKEKDKGSLRIVAENEVDVMFHRIQAYSEHGTFSRIEQLKKEFDEGYGRLREINLEEYSDALECFGKIQIQLNRYIELIRNMVPDNFGILSAIGGDFKTLKNDLMLIKSRFSATEDDGNIMFVLIGYKSSLDKTLISMWYLDLMNDIGILADFLESALAK